MAIVLAHNACTGGPLRIVAEATRWPKASYSPLQFVRAAVRCEKGCYIFLGVNQLKACLIKLSFSSSCGRDLFEHLSGSCYIRVTQAATRPFE